MFALALRCRIMLRGLSEPPYFTWLRALLNWSGRPAENGENPPQAQFLVAHVIPRRTFDAAWVLSVLAYWQDANYRAYQSHRKRRVARLNQRE